jgi:hypothetical protein
MYKIYDTLCSSEKSLVNNSKRILTQIIIHGTTFITYGIKKCSRIYLGYISVGDKIVNRKASIMSAVFHLLDDIEYQIAAPEIAIINAGDSAL